MSFAFKAAVSGTSPFAPVPCPVPVSSQPTAAGPHRARPLPQSIPSALVDGSVPLQAPESANGARHGRGSWGGADAEMQLREPKT